jgi:hypothetical protein
MATPREVWIKRIRRDTETLRSSSHPLYAKLRRIVAECGIDVDQSVVVDLGEADVNREGFFLITPPDRVFRVEYQYAGKDLRHGYLKEWTDISRGYEAYPQAQQIGIALHLLADPDQAQGSEQRLLTR